MSGTITIAEVGSRIDRLAPAERAAGWDRTGLQVGDPAKRVSTAAVCHEVTEEVVAALEARPVDLVVAYHPLLFHPTTRFTAGEGPAGRAFRLARAGVAVYVAHTNFDAATGGTADALADVLGAGRVVPFAAIHPAASHKIVAFVPEDASAAVSRAMADAGAGTIGRYTGCAFHVEGTGVFTAPPDASPAVGRAGETNEAREVRIEATVAAGAVDRVMAAVAAAHPYEEPALDVYERTGGTGFVGRIGALDHPVPLGSFAASVAGRLGGVVRFAGAPDRSVQRVAVVPGSGGGLVGEAASAGADVLVTGDVSHHRAREALDRGMGVVDPGHVATERPGIRRLYAAVSEIVRTVEDLDMDPDPWRGP